jgi:inhibitor of cysteine peptidase
MKRTIGLLTAFLVLIVLVGACSSEENGRTLTVENAGQTIEMNVGDIFTVELEGNPSTGYTWEVAEMDTALLKQVGEMEFETDNDLVGASGVLILRFEAIGPGETALILVYHRPWEEDIPPEETFEASLIVK